MLREEVVLPRGLVGPRSRSSDSQGILVRHASGEGQGAADLSDSRTLDGQAVGSARPQLSPPRATLGLPVCYAHLGSEPPFPFMCGSRQLLLGPRHKARRGGVPVVCST